MISTPRPSVMRVLGQDAHPILPHNRLLLCNYGYILAYVAIFYNCLQSVSTKKGSNALEKSLIFTSRRKDLPNHNSSVNLFHLQLVTNNQSNYLKNVARI